MKEKRALICVITVCLLVVACGGYFGYRSMRYVKSQNQQIAELKEEVAELNAKLDAQSTESDDWLDDGYNYLAIGNSITIHRECDYWWNEIGMAASDENHDYFHYVLEYLERENGDVKAVPYSFIVWETQGYDRAETLSFLDSYLSEKLDLITIQLGENVTDTNTYQEDFVSLINYVKEKAPNARIVVIDDFWIRDNRAELKKNAAEETGVEFVSLEGIADNEQYYCGLGTTVYDKEGNAHIVEHGGVAAHPGDEGMLVIAEAVIKTLKK